MFAPLNSEDEHTCLQAIKGFPYKTYLLYALPLHHKQERIISNQYSVQQLLIKINERMKQKLLTLFVLLVSAMTAFADDATGSGVGSETKTDKNELGSKGVAYSYTFTEENGSVTMTVKADGTGCTGIPTDASGKTCYLDYTYGPERAYNDSPSHTWDDLEAGTVIKVKLWWAVAWGRSETGDSTNPYITYTVKGSKIDDDEAPVMTKAEATNVFDTKATLTLNATDNINGILTYTVTIGENSYTVTGNAGKDVTIDITGLTAETKYDFSVTATDKANNVSEAKTGSFTTTTAFTLTAPATPTVEANKVISVLSATYTPATTWNFGSWGQSTVSENINVDGAPVIHLSKFNYIGLDGFSNQLDLSGMTHMHIDVLPVTMEGSLGVTPILASGDPKENSTKVGDKTTLKLGQWNAIDMPLSDFGLDFINNKVFQIKFDKGNNATDELYIANIYFYKESADEIDITINGNVAKVTGPITTANVKEINNKDVMNIDLTGVKSIEDGVKIQPLRKNAIIVISGTYKEEKINEETVCTTTADSKFDAIKDMKNVVVLAADGFYHPLKQLEFVDIPGEPLWTGGLKNIISTGNTGWKVTRTIPAHTHATVCVTNSIVNIPANLRAWEAVGYDETTGIQFNKANVIGANFPYVVRNATDDDTDLSFTGTNDLNFKTIMDTEAKKQQVGSTNIYFCGNWKEALVTDGSQWIIKNEGINASIVKANGVKISPFRAYFTGIPEGASAKLNFDDEETTGITNVNAAENNDDTLYNLAGQKVNAAYKGIVIKNGKKYLVK